MAGQTAPTELALWERLKANRLGVEFQCNKRVAGHTAAFFCPAARLVVEVDQPAEKGARRAASSRDERWKDLTVLRLAPDMTIDQMVERIDLKLHYLQVPRHLGEQADGESKNVA